MAFPVVQARQTGSTTTNATTHSITFPASIAAGELLLAFCSVDGQPIISNSQGRWAKIGGQHRNGTTVTGCCYAKIAEASGTLDDLTLVTTSEMASWVTMRITGHGGLPIGAGTNGSSTNSDPPSVTPPWGTQDYLWIAARMGDANVAATAAPTNYSNLTGVTHSDATNGASVHTAERSLNASAEDPGTFTSATEQWAALTVAVPPANINAPQLVGLYEVDSGATAGTTSLVTPTFTPNAGEVLVVKATTNDSLTTIGAPTGGSLTYTSRGAVTSGDFCYTTLYSAIVGSSPSSMAVTHTYGGAAGLRAVIVERWASAQLAGTPATNGTTTGSGAPSTTLTTAAANSIVSWVSGDWTPVVPAAYLYRSGANETSINDQSAAAGSPYVGYSAYQHAATAGSQTLGLSAPTGQAWSLLGVEVQYLLAAGATSATTAAATATANTSSPASATPTVTAAVTTAAGLVATATRTTTSAVTAAANTSSPAAATAATTSAVTAAASTGANVNAIATAATAAAANASTPAAATSVTTASITATASIPPPVATATTTAAISTTAFAGLVAAATRATTVAATATATRTDQANLSRVTTASVAVEADEARPTHDALIPTFSTMQPTRQLLLSPDEAWRLERLGVRLPSGS